jgi:hypothetical protein
MNLLHRLADPMNTVRRFAWLAVLLFVAPACTTNGFCFANCENTQEPGRDGGGTQPHLEGGTVFPADTGTKCVGFGCPTTTPEGGTSMCTPTNGGVEICDNIDNDCDGKIDQPGDGTTGIDFSDPLHCGNCSTDCIGTLTRVVTPVCHPPATGLGTTAGTCDYSGGCAPDYYDIDGNPANGCEYYCPWNPTGKNTQDLGGATGCGRDDDCDGKIDEDVNTCSDVQNCGLCGFACVLPHATPSCVTTSTDGVCDRSNTHCGVAACDAGYVDADGSADNGCEYQCTPTNGGVEICDGLDNDCNHQIDDADPGLVTSDPRVGASCFGGDKGLCIDPSHQGVAKCIDAAVQCCDPGSNNVASTNPNFQSTGLENGVCRSTVAPFVLTPGETVETCNGIDDDCNGVVDDNPTDAGGICGSLVGSCITGTKQCVGGALVCVGGTQPSPEICDGNDNDCDGVIDGTKPASPAACSSDADCASSAPNVICLPLSSNPNDKGCVKPPVDIADANGAPLVCDVPLPPPTGIPQPCRPGTMACFGGVPVCQGAITPQQGTDRCGEDTNCDGQLENQTGLTNNDPQNCGACGHDCASTSPNASFVCNNGVCVANGCAPGFIECGGSNPNDCETACTFTSSTEVCDGKDNNCNCKVDEAPITPPSVIQACGVSASATDPGCTSAKVTLACVNGGWQCTFTDSRYCGGSSCATTPDICDGLDNNCDGQIDEGFKPPALLVGFLGQACFSDDGEPAPGDGPCRTQGSFICKADGSSTQCSAKKDTSKETAEVCNGVDDDCNGLVDDNVAAHDSRISQACFGGTKGVCIAPANAGTTVCLSGAVVCGGANLVHPGDHAETCNGLDDDCNGVVDDNLIDAGGACGSSVEQCKSGTMLCTAGKLVCTGSVGAQPEICDGLDNNCNGQIDDNPTDVGTACNVPPTPPNGVPQPCKAGVSACIGSTKVCSGSITPTQATDNCNEDTNCDGKLTNQTGLKNSDVLNCGACGNNCNSIDANGIWSCQTGACVRTGCKSGFIDCDSNPNTCERACTFRSSTESCNGIDDDCNCKIDDNVPAATAVQVCGVSPAATDPGCAAATSCVSGAWKCAFASGYCTTGNCSTSPDACDGKDNNCNGVADEGFKPPLLTLSYLGQACTTPSTDGPCQGTGSYVCNSSGAATQCSATKDTTKSTPEICDGIDNNCNGQIDEAAAVATNDSRVGKQCFGGTQGACAATGHAGTTTCVGGAVSCQGANLLSPGQTPEICNGIDDDCNGIIDDNPTDVGGVCGSGVGACTQGKFACVTGAKVCQGAVGAKPETCNGIDDDCDGTIDDNLTDTGGNCNVPPAAPAPTAQCPVVAEPCKKGTLACVAGVLQCQGSTTASQSTPDSCCQDTNCDGQLTGQPNLQTDVANCGACGNDCRTKGGHEVWSCQAGVCTPSACQVGFINCDSNPNDCERACTFGGAELCNGVDDDCNCKVDDNVASVPSPSQVCGVSSAAQSVDAHCGAGDGTSGVLVTCSSGAWSCKFPTGYCDGGTPASCSTTSDNCDNKDNNCNGVIDDNYNKPILSTGYVNQPCASDDGKAPPGDGQCRTTGVFACNTTTSTKCNATKDLTKAGTEFCDGIDNDCDGSVDEPFSNKGTNTSFFVKPAVVQVSTTLFVYQYEASRPNSKTTSPGSGDGYWCTGCSNNVPNAPTGATLDKTPACSVPAKIPWFNVTPVEAEETCQAMGGSVCATADWTTSCQAGGTCQWGYSTAATCSTHPATLTAPDNTVYYDTSKTPFCNLGPYDFDLTVGAPNSDGLLPTNSSKLNGCFANLGGGLFDMTGNLREITKRAANDYPLMGGAFNSQSDDGASCTFNFYTVPTTFKFFDTGFRCCFSSDPTK